MQFILVFFVFSFYLFRSFDRNIHDETWGRGIERIISGCNVVSGFSSKLERDVWRFLVKGQQPIILVLARSLYLRVPPELQSLLDAGRLLIISTSASDRQSKLCYLCSAKLYDSRYLETDVLCPSQ